MSKYNHKSNELDLYQRLVNVIEYVLFLYEKKIISERTKDEILKRCNPDLYEGK